MLLSIIIVNYNVKYFLEQCLCSVKAALSGIAAEVLVIDNCSPDGSIDYLQPNFSWVTFIQNQKNEGFAKANNKALLLAKGEYILFLNPDTILVEDTLQQCIVFFTSRADAGAVGVRMIDGSGAFLPESKRAFPSPVVSFYKLAGLSALFKKSKKFNKYALGFLAEKEVHPVDVLSGAFMMIKKNILDSIGGFDEQFFMYAEDIDLSYRIQKAGYKNYYLGDVTITHFKGESTAKSSIKYVQIFYQAMRLFVKKYYSGAGAWFIYQGLQTGIWMRGFMAALALPFTKKKQIIIFLPKRIYITGDEAQFEAASIILKNFYPAASIVFLPNTAQLFSNNANDLMVFCTGNFLYKDAAAIIQNTGNKMRCMWFGKDTRSIVGSDNKNGSGYVIKAKIKM